MCYKRFRVLLVPDLGAASLYLGEKTDFMTDQNVNQEDGPGTTSTSLLERLKGQDQAAWQRVYALYGPLVHRWCRQAGLQDADAADQVQEVFRAVDRKIGDFRRDRPGDSFRGWLRTITRNKVLDFQKDNAMGPVGIGGSDAQERWQQLPEESSAPDGGAAELAEETRLLYERAVTLLRKEFEPNTWQAFWRVAVDGQTPDEVAHALDISVNAVYLAKSRVLRRLREEFVGLMEV